MLRKHWIVTCLALVFSVFAASDSSAAKRHLHSAVSAKVEQLIRLIDKDKNGRVSKAEFLQFMAQEFDRIDTDRSGGLTHKEISRPVIVSHAQARYPGGVRR